MRIAILGDIHGNFEALKAAYTAAASKKAERIFHFGDLGGCAPFVNEVVDFLIEHEISGVQGNYDEAVAYGRQHCGCKYENPVQAEMMALSLEWTKKHVSRKSKDYMKNLPFELSFIVNGKKVKIFHASPLKNNLYWYEDRPDKFFHNMAEKTGADIMIYGHTHIHYRKDIGNRVFINGGSVGRPKGGDPRTCVALIEITQESIKTDFIRAHYDIEKTASAIATSGLPPYFSEMLKEGK